jgi:hypothetical protein
MKKFYFFALYAIVIISLGNSAGAGLIQNRDFTGSPLSSGTCNNCHGGGNFSPVPVIEVLDGGTPVTNYVPGQNYIVRLTINSSNFPSGFGFQMVSLDGSDNDGGEFGTAPSGTRTVKVNNRTYFEHSQRQGVNQWDIPWIAPDLGTGDVSMFAVGNAVNANGGTSGDVAATSFITLLEDAGSATSSTFLSKQINIFPVPVESILNIDVSNLQMDYGGVEIVDLNGRLITTSADQKVDLGHLGTGSYLAVIRLDDEIAVKRFVKL